MSGIVKQEGVYKLLQEGDSEKCLKKRVFIAHCVLFNPCKTVCYSVFCCFLNRCVESIL